MLFQNVLGFHRLAAGHSCVPTHRWVQTHRFEVLHGAVFLLIRLPATSSRHPSLLLLRLHFPVLLQRLLQPLSLLLQHYLRVSSHHPPPPLSLPLTMMASPRCRASGAAIKPPKPPRLVSHPRHPPSQNRSFLHSESPFKMLFRRPTTPLLSLPMSLPMVDNTKQQQTLYTITFFVITHISLHYVFRFLLFLYIYIYHYLLVKDRLRLDTDQKDPCCNCCSGRDAILVYFGSGDLSVPR